MNEALILDIKGNSLDDGPGIRTVVFFKGCPLNCVWCHNPEGKRSVVELSWDGKECIGCFSCSKVCTENAINKKNPYFIDREQCTFCFQCVEVCPSGAMNRVGKFMTVDDIVKEIVKDKPFFVTSGGGVTLSGGEPTFNLPFVTQLLQKLKEENMHTLVETCGLFNWSIFEKALPYIDTVYYDIKLMDVKEHQEYCGVSNDIIISNFKKLASLRTDAHYELLPRIPLVPEITATTRNLELITLFLQQLGFSKAALLRYNPLWPEKCEKIGVENKLRVKSYTTWMSDEEVERCCTVFLDSGFDLA